MKILKELTTLALLLVCTLVVFSHLPGLLRITAALVLGAFLVWYWD